jgi:hypothetical protein
MLIIMGGLQRRRFDASLALSSICSLRMVALLQVGRGGRRGMIVRRLVELL